MQSMIIRTESTHQIWVTAVILHLGFSPLFTSKVQWVGASTLGAAAQEAYRTECFGLAFHFLHDGRWRSWWQDAGHHWAPYHWTNDICPDLTLNCSASTHPFCVQLQWCWNLSLYSDLCVLIFEEYWDTCRQAGPATRERVPFPEAPQVMKVLAMDGKDLKLLGSKLAHWSPTFEWIASELLSQVARQSQRDARRKGGGRNQETYNFQSEQQCEFDDTTDDAWRNSFEPGATHTLSTSVHGWRPSSEFHASNWSSDHVLNWSGESAAVTLLQFLAAFN